MVTVCRVTTPTWPPLWMEPPRVPALHPTMVVLYRVGARAAYMPPPAYFAALSST